MSKPTWVQEFFDYYKPMTTGEDTIFNRLKTRNVDMKYVYDEIEEQIDSAEFPRGRYVVLEDVIHAAIMCGKKKEITEGTNGVKDLKELNEKICTATENLNKLLDARDVLLEDSYLTHKARIDPVRLIREAGRTMRPKERRLFFKREVLPIFGDIENPVLNTAAVHGDMPTLQEILTALSKEISTTSIEGRSRSIKQILDYHKGQTEPHFVRLLLRDLSRSSFVGYLPLDFSLTPEAIATITGCALNLDGGYTRAATLKAVKQGQKKFNEKYNTS